jgi:hypothetical protein
MALSAQREEKPRERKNISQVKNDTSSPVDLGPTQYKPTLLPMETGINIKICTF